MDCKKVIDDLLYEAYFNITKDYDKTALLLNACEICYDFYSIREENIGLLTAGNIPPEYRLPLEMLTPYDKKKLMEQYAKELPIKIVKDYLITTISTLDGLIEDIYEVVLMNQERDKTEEQIKKMVRWGEGFLPNDLLDRLPKLKEHKNPKGYTLRNFFDVYEILRQLRHALIHTKGELKRKHLRKIAQLEENIPESARISNTEIIKDNKVNLMPATAYILRFWVYNFVSFLIVAMREALEDEE
jgi:hypothetical protein